MSYPLLAAQNSKFVDDVYVSTDSEAIAKVGTKFGAKIIKRPAELATSEAVLEGAFLHAYKFIKDQFKSDDYIQRHEKVKELHRLAEDLGLPLVNLALCWCLKNQNVSTLILGASKVEQLRQNLDSINHMECLDDSAMERIETILNNTP